MARGTIAVTLYMSELIYDVQNKAFLTGRSRSNGQNHEEVANMQANDDDEDANQVIRSIGNAFATLKTKLSEYVTSGTTATNNALIDANTNLYITLTMPSNYNYSTAETITAAMHQYIVNMALGEWFTITDKTDAADYIALAGNNLQQIREAINKRNRPERSSII